MGIAETDLTRDRVALLFGELSAKFVAHSTYRRAIMSVLEPLSEGWANHEQGMEGESFDRMNAALVSQFETLRVIPADQAGYALDQLAVAWERVRGGLWWVG